jgi:hypothetical protein
MKVKVKHAELRCEHQKLVVVGGPYSPDQCQECWKKVNGGLAARQVNQTRAEVTVGKPETGITRHHLRTLEVIRQFPCDHLGAIAHRMSCVCPAKHFYVCGQGHGNVGLVQPIRDCRRCTDYKSEDSHDLDDPPDLEKPVVGNQDELKP